MRNSALNDDDDGKNYSSHGESNSGHRKSLHKTRRGMSFYSENDSNRQLIHWRPHFQHRKRTIVRSVSLNSAKRASWTHIWGHTLVSTKKRNSPFFIPREKFWEKNCQMSKCFQVKNLSGVRRVMRYSVAKTVGPSICLLIMVRKMLSFPEMSATNLSLPNVCRW